MSTTKGVTREARSVDAVTAYRVTPQDLETLTEGHPYSFIDYMLSFYGKGGVYDYDFTASEVVQGTIKYLNMPRTKFEGDSIDRERVRDIILDDIRHRVQPHTHVMRPLDDSGSYECVRCGYEEIKGLTPESEV